MTGTNTTGIKRAVRWAGSGLSVIAVLFVVSRLTTHAGEMGLSVVTPLIMPILLLCVAFGLANIFLALAWKNILAHFDVFPTLGLAIGVYAESQLAKYVPGNVFQFLSRQALGTGTGMAAMVVAKSALWELALLAVSGSLAILLFAPRFLSVVGTGLSLGLFAVAVLVLAWVSARWLSGWITRALAWQMLFLASSGLVFVFVLSSILPGPVPAPLMVCAAYIVAWLAGLVTPGAPAGAGIREVVLLALLQSLVGEADLLLAILAGRVVTIGGDLLFYLAGVSLKMHRKTGC